MSNHGDCLISLSTPSMPVYVEYDPTDHLVFVSMPQIDQIAVLAALRHEWKQPINVPSYPGFLAMIPSKRFLVTANYNDASLSFIDLHTRKIDTTVPAARYPRELAISPNGDMLLSTNFHTGTISIIGMSTGSPILIGAVKVGPRPAAAAFLDNCTALVLDSEERSIMIVDCSALKVLRRQMSPAEPRAAIVPSQSGEAYVIFPKMSQLSVVDRDGNTVATIPTGKGPIFLDKMRDGMRAFVVNMAGDSVTFVDLASKSAIATMQVGPQPLRAYEIPGTGLVVVANRGDDSLSIIDTDRYRVVGRVAVCAGAFGGAVSPDGETIYIANEENQSLTVWSVKKWLLQRF
jgi:DNA-binding beta-propeller fold protein YncE